MNDILVIFMTTHNPTTLNQQGADRGTQYRSVIFYHNKQQKEISEIVIKKVAPYYEDVIVTEISEIPVFYEAEKDHQDFYKNNQEMGYCTYVINPKLSRLRDLHSDKLK